MALEIIITEKEGKKKAVLVLEVIVQRAKVVRNSSVGKYGQDIKLVTELELNYQEVKNHVAGRAWYGPPGGLDPELPYHSSPTCLPPAGGSLYTCGEIHPGVLSGQCANAIGKIPF